MPTLCEMAGVAAPKARILDGASLAPLLHGKPLRRTGRPLHWHYFNALDRPRAAMRDGDWKILGMPSPPAGRAPGSSFQPGDIEYIRGMELTQFELYNLKDDPGETTNLAATEKKRLAVMRETLLWLHEEVKRESPAWS
jgi:arylsulfatase A